MTNFAKISILAWIVLAAAYAIIVLEQDENQDEQQPPEAQVTAPVSQLSNIPVAATNPQPLSETNKVAVVTEQSIAKKGLKNQQLHDIKPRAELDRYNRLAPAPPLAPGQSVDARHDNSAQRNELGHGHAQPVNSNNNKSQAAPPSGADI